MAISGMGHNYYQNNVTTTKSKKSVNTTEETGSTKKLSEAEEMAAFKKEFYFEIAKIPKDRTIANVAINISEEAFKNMKDDPKYREQMLSLIKRDMTGSVAPAPDCSMVITVGATAKDYRADSWSVNNDSEFYARSQNSFYKKMSEKKDRQKELLEEYLEKRAQAKKQQQELLDEKIAKQEQERIRLLRSWNNERQLEKADSFASKVTQKSPVSPKDMTLEEYKEYIHDKISQIPMHPSRMQENISINISESGFEAMKNNPEYEAWVLNDLRMGWAQPDRWASVCGGAYSTIYYGATKEECHAEMWSARYQNGSGKSLFEGKAKDSFWERRVEQKKRIEAQVKEQQEKKRIQKEAYEKAALYSDSILSKSANVGTISTANAAYEANFLMADNVLF